VQQGDGEGYRFANFQLDLERGVLLRGGVEIPLRPKLLALLALLIRQRDRIVSREEILESVWGGTHISEATLSSTLRDLRRILGDDATEPRVVRTLWRRGYRFVHPVEVSRGPSGTAQPQAVGWPVGSNSAFVGRQSLLSSAVHWIEEARTGRGRAVFLAGTPGIGKTRLALEIGQIATDAGLEVHVGRCLEEEGAPAYWPWVQIVRSMLRGRGPAQTGASGAHAEAALRLVTEQAAGAGNGGAADERFRLFDGLTQFLLAAARATPQLIVLDDLHRADASSTALLGHLLREMATAPIALVGTYRDSEVAADPGLGAIFSHMHPTGQRLELGGLSREEVGELVFLVSGQVASADLIDVLHDRTQGNPLFVAEITRTLLQEGVLDAPVGPARAARAAPAGVRDVIRERVRRLPGPSVPLLETASVIGREFEVDLLLRVRAELPPASIRAVLDTAVSAGLVTESRETIGRLHFAHILVRDALYESLSGARRAELHRAIGRAIETSRAAELEFHLDELALHFREAIGLGEADRAVSYSRRAGERALAQTAYDEAATRFGAALAALLLKAVDPEAGDTELEATLRERGALLLQLGRARWGSGATDLARESFLEAIDVARRIGSAELLARGALGYVGRTDATPGVNRPAVALLEEALVSLPGSSSALRAEVLARLGTELYYDSDAERSEALTREALACAEDTGDPDLLSYVLSAHHYTLLRPDVDPRQRLRISERMAELAAGSNAGDVQALGLQEQALDHLELGDITKLDQALHRYVEVVEELGQPFFLWMSGALRGMRALLDGRLLEAERLAQETLDLGQSFSTPNAFSVFAVQLFCVRQEQGRLHELESVLHHVIDERQVFPGLRAGLAAIHTQMGRPNETRDVLEQLMADDFADVPRDHHWLSALGGLTPACVFLADEARAHQLYDALEPCAGRFISVAHGSACLGAVTHHLARLAGVYGDLETAEEHYEAALAQHRRARARLLLAHTQRHYGAMLWKRGGPRDRPRARELLGLAVDAYERLGLPHAAAETRRLTGAR
jgi:DNA-binding winged helix-turn-helix (wHTH) protein/tetratricopeptide (TPR) repeat protein